MSYILDALKRADADRDRQLAAVPDLHAQSDALPYRELSSAPPARWWMLGAAVFAVVALGAAWWTLGSRDAPAPATASTPAPAMAAAPPTVQSGLPAQVPTPTPTPIPAPIPTPTPTPRAVPPRPAAPAPAVAVAPTPPAVAPAPTARLPLYAALPPALRSQMPVLSVNGSVYSRTRSSRIVILNGQVFREGDRPTEGLVVEEIRLKSSVLSFRGTRFELPY